jgi:hypothetical protein
MRRPFQQKPGKTRDSFPSQSLQGALHLETVDSSHDEHPSIALLLMLSEEEKSCLIQMILTEELSLYQSQSVLGTESQRYIQWRMVMKGLCYKMRKCLGTL